MALTHAFTSNMPGSGLVGAAHWNAEHEFTPVASDNDIPVGEIRVTDIGTTPNRVLALKFNDNGTIRTIASITFLLALFVAGRLEAQTTRTLCDSGCTYTNSGANLQTAIDASVGGDIILLQEGVTYSRSATFTLPEHTGADYVTIKTGVKADGSLVTEADFPAANVRITPAYANKLAKLTVTNEAENYVVRTSITGGQVRYWALKRLELIGYTADNDWRLISLGSPSYSEIATRALIPDYFQLDQLYLHGYSNTARSRAGVVVSAGHTTITNSYFEYFGMVGSDSQCIAGEGATDLTITNNYLRGGAEVFLMGGSDGPAIASTSVTAQGDTTHITVASTTNLVQGQTIQVAVAGKRILTTISAINGNILTISPEVANAEIDVSGSVRGGVVATNLTFTKNYLTNDVADRAVGTYIHKNSFELKNMDTALIEGNIFENVWFDAQMGYAILFKAETSTYAPGIYSRGNPSAQLKNITFRHNVVRHAAAGINLVGGDPSGYPGSQTDTIVISNNVFYDIDRRLAPDGWGSNDSSARLALVQCSYVSAANSPTGVLQHPYGPKNVTFEHNTLDGPYMYGTVQLDTYADSIACPAENFVFRNNLVKKGSSDAANYGTVWGTSCSSPFDTQCWPVRTSGASVWNMNVLTDVVAANWPDTTYAPTTATLNSYYTSYTGVGSTQTITGFALTGATPYDNGGTDGADIGAPISAITAFTDIATSGNNSGGVAAPSITTASLAGGTVGTAYSQSLAGTSGTAPYTWSVTVGTLPDGLTLTGATISGTPTTAGTSTFTVQLTDQQPVSVTRALSITVAAVGVTVAPRPLKHGAAEGLVFARATDPFADGDEINLGDLWSDTSSTPLVKVATALGPPIVWSAVSANPSSSAYVNALIRPGTVDANAAEVLTSWTVATGVTEEMFNTGTAYRVSANLTNMTDCRLWARVGTTLASGYLYLQYSADDMGTWASLGTTTLTPTASVGARNVSTFGTLGAWAPIRDAAKGQIWLRVVAYGPNGSFEIGSVGYTCKP